MLYRCPLQRSEESRSRISSPTRPPPGGAGGYRLRTSTTAGGARFRICATCSPPTFGSSATDNSSARAAWAAAPRICLTWVAFGSGWRKADPAAASAARAASLAPGSRQPEHHKRPFVLPRRHRASPWSAWLRPRMIGQFQRQREAGCLADARARRFPARFVRTPPHSRLPLATRRDQAPCRTRMSYPRPIRQLRKRRGRKPIYYRISYL